MLLYICALSTLKGMIFIMKEQIKIDKFDDGFKLENANCIDITIAGAAGYYNRNYYFYYLFLWSVYANWQDNTQISWSGFREKLLNKLGLKLNIVEVNEGDFLNTVYKNVDNVIPTILIVKYNQVFYLDTYMEINNLNPHATIIAGYDSKKGQILVKDASLYRVNNYREGIYNIYLKENMLRHIWESSQIEFKRENDFFAYKIYTIEKSTVSAIDSYFYLLIVYLNEYQKTNYLMRILDSFNNNIELIRTDNQIEIIRRISYGSMKLFFYILEKIVKEIEENTLILNRLKDLESHYLNNRNLLLSMLHANALKNMKMTNEEKEKMKEAIMKEDEDIYRVISDIVIMKSNKKYDEPFRVDVL